MKKNLVLFIFLISSSLFAQSRNYWLTDYEKSDCLRTPRYDKTVAYCKRLAKASPWVYYTSFGKSPQGRDLPLVIVSKEKAFTPALAAKSGKVILLIQSSIHAGEMDGKDASLMLIRDIVVNKTKANLLDHTIILFVPIFNVDGHERFGPNNRINQNGPIEMGWRTTAQNLNLNRDYMKADAPEMRSMLRLFTSWLPDFYIDCHVTDGIDFQYDVTYAMEVYANIDREIAAWCRDKYLPFMISSVEKSGHQMAPYIFPREDRDLSKGFSTGAALPRFSTGYGAVQNRPTLLIETHMLKPYKTRVESTYEILDATIRFANNESRNLRALNKKADERSALLGQSGSSVLPLRLESTNESRPLEFKGIRSTQQFSDISTSEWTIYTGEPYTLTVPYFDKMRITDSVIVPRYYLVPREWMNVIEVMKAHGIVLFQLKDSLTQFVEYYKLNDPKWQERPYEGRHQVKFTSELLKEKRLIPAGTIVVPTNQRSARVIINLLEPNGPDSFVSWGFFDAIFEQKEYAEDYIIEKLAREMIAKDPQLEKDFNEKLKTDTAFAKNPHARLNFFYQRSQYWDKTIGVYPVVRVMEDIGKNKLKPMLK